MLNLGEKLYYKLPSVYISEDSKIEPSPYPLQRFLKVLGGGFDFIESKVEDFGNVIDIDICPPEYLQLIASMLGIEFPYSLDEATQRRYIKIIPVLNRLKGTTSSFEYLARETFGSSAVVSAYKIPYEEGMTPEEWRRILVRVELDGESTYLANKEENFKKFAEILRPANYKLVTDLAMFYLDRVTTRTNAEYLNDIFLDTNTEDFLKSRLLDTYLFEDMFLTDLEEYPLTRLDYTEDITHYLDLETAKRTDVDYADVQITLPAELTDTYPKKTTSEATTHFVTLATGISHLSTTNVKLTTSFKTTNYAPLNPTINH